MYGTTEVGVILANYPGAGDFAGKPGALGMPVPGVKVEVQRPDGSACAPDEVGEIKVWRHGSMVSDQGSRLDRCGWLLLPRRARGRRDHLRRLDDERDRDRGYAAASSGGARGSGDRRARRPARPGGQGVRRDRPARTTMRSAGDIQDFVRARLSQHEYPRIVAFVAELPKTRPARSTARRCVSARQQEPA